MLLQNTDNLGLANAANNIWMNKINRDIEKNIYDNFSVTWFFFLSTY